MIKLVVAIMWSEKNKNNFVLTQLILSKFNTNLNALNHAIEKLFQMITFFESMNQAHQIYAKYY